MSLPLLRLPLLASTNVINSIDVKDFVNLIRTSTRMRNVVKYSRVPIDLTICGNEGFEFQKLSDPDRAMFVQVTVKRLSIVEQGNVPFKPSVFQGWDCKSETDLEGYRRMMDDFVDIFRIKSVDFDITNACCRCLPYLEYAMKLGIKFKKAHLSISEENSGDRRKILSACAHASELYLTSYGCSESFRFEGFHEYAMDRFELHIDDYYLEWFTVDHLCALVNCSSVKINNMKVPDAGLNKFLKHWMAGSGKMKTLAVSLDDPNYHWDNPINPQTVMDGIPRREIETIYDGKFEIERSDGVKAYVTCMCDAFTLGDLDFRF